MRSKEIVSQRPLFVDWPTWQQLPTEVRQRAEHLLANICLEVVKPCKHSNTHNTPEQCDERSTD